MARNDVVNSDGSINWDLVGGYNDTLASHTSQLADIMHDVKSPTYGAKGDGITDDSTAINNAINFVANQSFGSSSGGCVLLPTGTYKCNSSINLKSNVKLIGTNVTLDFSTSGANGVVCSSVSNIELHSISVTSDPNHYGVYLTGTSNAKLNNVNTTGGYYGCAIQNSSSNVIVENSSFNNAGSASGTGLQVYQSSNIFISKCKANNNYSHGFVLWNADYVSIVQCQANNNGNTANNFGGGIVVSLGVTHCVVDACLMLGNVFAGLDLDMQQNQAPLNTDSYSIFSNNIIKDTQSTTGCGIFLQYGNYCNLDNNLIYNCGYGIQLKNSNHANINNNKIYNASYRGIYLTSTSGTNNVYNNVTANEINGGATVVNASSSMTLNNQNNVIVSGNIFSSSTYEGISMSGCNYVKFTGNILDNMCITASSYPYTIYIGTSNNINISENVINSASGSNYCIGVDGSSTVVIVRNNNIYGSYTYLFSSGYRPTVYTGNYIKGNPTDAEGTASIAASGTTVVVNHGLSTTPTNIVITPQGNLGNVWVSSITSTQFTINCSVAPASATTVSWQANV